MQRSTLNFTYKDDNEMEVFYFGDFAKKTCLLMKDSDKKWEFACRLDSIQNTEHMTPQYHAKQIENVVDDLGDYLISRPYDQHFSI